jgi:hypothetical protein
MPTVDANRRPAPLPLLAAIAVVVAVAPLAAAGAPPSSQQPAAARANPPLRFDFGTPESPVAEGYTQVTERMVYTRSRGFGWHEGDEVICRDRERGDALRRDLCFAQWAEFLVDVPDGTYDVKVTMGDATGAHDHQGLLLQGRRVADVTSAVGEYFVKTFRVAVANGRLSVVIDDLAGEDVNVVINGLEIVPVAATP